MGDGDAGELLMRVAGLSEPGAFERLEQVVRTADAEASLRLDRGTGILHVTTRRDALEIDAALTDAGFDVSGLTG